MEQPFSRFSFAFFLFLCLALAPVFLWAKESKTAQNTSEGISLKEVRQAYAKYLRQSALLGITAKECEKANCESSLNTLFRASGLYGYPVPADADVLQHRQKKMECYRTGGVLAQVIRQKKGGALQKATIIQSRSPKAMKQLVQLCKKGPLELSREKDTGLERIAGLPIGAAGADFCREAQGLFVQVLNFNNSRTNCRSLDFLDNAWVGGLEINESRCRQTRADLDLTLKEKMEPFEFANKERKRQFDQLVKKAQEQGYSKKKAEQAVREMFSSKTSDDVMMVGAALRNIEACNLVNLGLEPVSNGSTKPRNTKTPKADEGRYKSAN